MEAGRCSKKQIGDIAAFFSVTYDDGLTLSPSASSAPNFTALSLDSGNLDELNPRASKRTLRSMFSKVSKALTLSSQAPSQARLDLDDVGVDADNLDLEEAKLGGTRKRGSIRSSIMSPSPAQLTLDAPHVATANDPCSSLGGGALSPDLEELKQLFLKNLRNLDPAEVKSWTAILKERDEYR